MRVGAGIQTWTLSVLLAVGLPAWAQAGRPPFAPVVAETPWGQKVVPTLDTYVDIQVWPALKPGQAWSAGDALARKLREDAKAGRLKLRTHPWRILDGVYALGRDDYEQLSYLLDTGEGLLLVDPGIDAWQPVLQAEIRQLGLDPGQVKWVLLTHGHIDHGQSCAAWRDRGARILVGEGDAHPIESCNSLVATWVEPEAQGRCQPCPVDQRVHDGDILRLGKLTLHAIGTPGHTPGSTCFTLVKEGRQVLISGDIALHHGRHAWMGNPYADWNLYLAALRKLLDFSLEGKAVRFDLLLPGHGTVDLDGAQGSIQDTERIVRSIVARRAAGEKVEWIEPYPWFWAQGITYGSR